MRGAGAPAGAAGGAPEGAGAARLAEAWARAEAEAAPDTRETAERMRAVWEGESDEAPWWAVAARRRAGGPVRVVSVTLPEGVAKAFDVRGGSRLMAVVRGAYVRWRG